MKSNYARALVIVALTVPVLLACSDDEKKDGRGSAGAGFAGVGSGTSGSGAGTGFAGVGLGTSGSGAAGVSAAGASGSGNSCAEGSASAARLVPTVMLVVDGSCSMSTEYPGGSPDTISCSESPTNRWSAIRNALVDPTTGVVTRLQSVVRFGLGVYGTVGSCPFVLGRIEPAVDNGAAITAGLPTIPPGLATPTPEALMAAYDSLPDTSLAVDENLGPQIVVLATDGAPNGCQDLFTSTQPQSLAAVMAGRAKNIKTYVVSLAAPNGALQQHLQQLANAGQGMDPATGTAQLYEPTDPAALSAALEAIVGAEVGCAVTLNGDVTQGMECNGSLVELNSIPLTCNDPNGWRLVAPNQIELQGTACEDFKANSASIVRADFPCDIFRPD